MATELPVPKNKHGKWEQLILDVTEIGGTYSINDIRRAINEKLPDEKYDQIRRNTNRIEEEFYNSYFAKLGEFYKRVR